MVTKSNTRRSLLALNAAEKEILENKPYQGWASKAYTLCYNKINEIIHLELPDLSELVPLIGQSKSPELLNWDLIGSNRAPRDSVAKVLGMDETEQEMLALVFQFTHLFLCTIDGQQAYYNITWEQVQRWFNNCWHVADLQHYIHPDYERFFFGPSTKGKIVAEDGYGRQTCLAEPIVTYALWVTSKVMEAYYGFPIIELTCYNWLKLHRDSEKYVLLIEEV